MTVVKEKNLWQKVKIVCQYAFQQSIHLKIMLPTSFDWWSPLRSNRDFARPEVVRNDS